MKRLASIASVSLSLSLVCLSGAAFAQSAEDKATAQSLFDLAVPLALGEPPAFGDLCFYGKGEKDISHVTLCISRTVCIGANGGTSKTNGDDPKAFVRIEPILYRSDFRGVRRVAPIKGKR